MPIDIPMTAILIIFYLVFASQIFLLSIHYPSKMIKRIRYVLSNYPPDEYPKLYPEGHTAVVADREASRLTMIERYSRGVALIGIAILIFMLGSGYQPKEKGGDEIFVMLYFFLQVAPFMLIAFKEMQQFKRMQAGYNASRRSADLRPRRLFDFIAPGYVLAALVMFTLWISFYLWQAGDPAAWGWEIYSTLVLIPGMNIAYGLLIARYLVGKKLDPYQAPADQIRAIGTTIHIFVISSIMISFFLLVTEAADVYAFEVFDPPLTSFYLQLCLVMGVGLTLRQVKIEDVDFEVYRKDVPST